MPTKQSWTLCRFSVRTNKFEVQEFVSHAWEETKGTYYLTSRTTILYIDESVAEDIGSLFEAYEIAIKKNLYQVMSDPPLSPSRLFCQAYIAYS